VLLHTCMLLCCYNFIDLDYYIRQRSIRLSTGSNGTSTYLNTREDTTQETLEECFRIKIDYDGKPNNTNCDLTEICILDDDGTYTLSVDNYCNLYSALTL